MNFFLIFSALITQASMEPQELVRCSEIAFSNSAEQRDADRFKSFLDPDARFVSGEVRRGPESVTEGWAPYFAPEGPTIRWRPATVEVTQDGALALSRGPYRITMPDGSGLPEAWGHFISTWRRSGDGWKVLFDSGGDHGMTPTEDERQLMEAPDGCEGSE